VDTLSGTLPNKCRPLQIIPAFEDWAGTSDDVIRKNVRALRDTGLGGLVTNVNLKDYLRDEKAWEVFRRGVTIAHEEGLRVWIYDEEGYPSGAAGGLVLEQMPSAEAQGLIRVVDPGGGVHYDVIQLYEGTHATGNFYKKRHYINILDPAGVATFLAVTHDHYARVLEPIATYVEAFFTDEPSLISTYIPKDRDYPQTLPWHPRLPEEFRTRKGYDLLPHRESLFLKTGPSDRKIRCDFYEVIADLCAETYFGGLQDWCHRHHVASSGHLLGEETMVWQTDFDGDPFTCYRKFDIPGIDMILSDPVEILATEYFLVPKIAGSSARVQGTRRVMCEISDFFGMMDKKPATIDQMKCTAGILYSFGVTDLCSYYPLSLAPESKITSTEFSPQVYKAWTENVTRLNAIFTSGTIDTRVALLYPMVSVWSHFTPSARSMYEPHPSADVRFLDGAFADLCRSLLQQQIDYDIIDERSLAAATIEGKTLVIADRRYEVLLLPPIDTIRLRTMETIVWFVSSHGAVLAHPRLPRYAAEGPDFDDRVTSMIEAVHAAGALGGSAPGAPPVGYLIKSLLPPECTLDPPSPDVLCTRIRREEGNAEFFVNISSSEYSGTCIYRTGGNVQAYDPATGEKQSVAWSEAKGAGHHAPLKLPPFGTLFHLFS
jgi:hypothetical protein